MSVAMSIPPKQAAKWLRSLADRVGKAKATVEIVSIRLEMLRQSGSPMYMLGSSYNCPTFKLYGYATDLALIRAIQRKYRKETDRIEAQERGR